VTGRRGDGDTERLIDGETGRDLPGINPDRVQNPVGVPANTNGSFQYPG